MVPKYLMQVMRRPLPGKSLELLQAVSAVRSNMDIPMGTTTVSVAAPNQMVVTSTPYESLAVMQSVVDEADENDELQNELIRIESLASSTVHRLSLIYQLPDDMLKAKFVQRYVFKHDSMSRRQLIAAIQEFSDQSDNPKVGIIASMNDNVVVVSRPLESLVELEGSFDRLRDDPATITRASNVQIHCTDWISVIAKVMSRP